MKVLVSDHSPSTLLAGKIREWNDSNNFCKRELLTRAVTLVAGSVFALMSIVYNAVTFVGKAPITLLKYTIGYIPTKNGRLGDLLPEGFEAIEMWKHAYKIPLFALDIILAPILGLIHTKSYVKVLEKLTLLPKVPKESFDLREELIVQRAADKKTTDAVETPAPEKIFESFIAEQLKLRRASVSPNPADSETVDSYDPVDSESFDSYEDVVDVPVPADPSKSVQPVGRIAVDLKSLAGSPNANRMMALANAKSSKIVDSSMNEKLDDEWADDENSPPNS